MKDYKFKKETIILVCLMLTMSLFITAGLGWFAATSHKRVTNISGRVLIVPDYFDGGDGTESNPYIISEPEHLKNLAWLQYMGYFNKVKDGSISTTYFKVAPKGGATTLDMTGWVLPPIGTSQYPFIGNFDGNGCTIQGLETTNISSRDAYIDNKGKVHTPDVISSVVESNVTSIGMFGMVGYVDGGSGSPSYNEQANALKNFHINQATIKSQTSTALVGICAGYVNGTLSSIGVVDSSIKDTKGASAVTGYTSRISDYSLVGYCESKYLDSSDEENVEISKPKRTYLKKDGGVPGGGTAWGASIYMGDFYSRMNAIKALASPITYYSEVTEYRYDDGRVVTTPASTSTTRTNSYITNYTNTAGGTGSATFTSDSGSGIFSAEDFYLYGKNTFNPGDTIKHVYRVYYKTNAIKIKSGSYYLNAKLDSSGNPSIVAETDKATAWAFSTENKEGYLSATLSGTDYYLNMDSSNNLYISSTPSTYWYYRDKEVFNTKNQGESASTYYYLQYTNNNWNIKKENTSTYYISQDGNYLKYDGSLQNTTRQADASKWTMNSNNTIFTGTGTYLVADGTSLGVHTTNKTAFTLYEPTTGGKIGLESGNYRMAYADGSWKMVLKTIYGYYFSDTYWGTRNWLTIDNSNQISRIKDKASAAIWRNDSNNDLENYHKWYTLKNNVKYYIARGDASSARYEIDITTNVNSARDVRLNQNTLFYYSSNNHYITIHTDGTFMFTRLSSGGSEYEPVYQSDATLTRIKTNNPNASILNVTEVKDSEECYEQLPDEYTYTTPDTYVPILANTSSPYGATSGNTGYITSGSTWGGTQQGRVDYLTDAGDTRVSSNTVTAGWLDFSLGGGLGISYSAENLEVVTPLKTSGNSDSCTYVRIRDDFNQEHTPGILNWIQYRFPNKYRYDNSDNNGLSLTRYYTARTNINDLFEESSRLYGFRFNAGSVTVGNTFTAQNITTIDKDAKTVTHSTYELPRDCINFTVANDGYVNLFAASYYTGTKSFYNLYQVFRDENNTITAIKPISKIFKTGDKSYAYQYGDDGSYSDGKSHSNTDLVFNVDWMISASDTNKKYVNGNAGSGTANSGRYEILEECLYYFEFPLEKGEYALGAADNNADTAHIVYLDIGANSQTVTETTVEEIIKDTVQTYKYPKGIQFQESVSDSLTNISCDASIGLAAGGSAGDTVTYDRVGNNVTATTRTGNTITYEKAGVTIKNTDGTSMSKTYASSTGTMTKKTEFIMKNADTGVELEHTITTVVETLLNDGVANRTKTKKDVMTGEEQTLVPTAADAIEQGEIGLKYHYAIPSGALTRAMILARITGVVEDETTGENTVEARYEISEKSSASSFNIYVDKVIECMNASLLNKYVMNDTPIIPSTDKPE